MSANLEFDTLPVKPQEARLLLDTMKSETKVEWHESAYCFILTGSFQEIQNARKYLLNHLKTRGRGRNPPRPDPHDRVKNQTAHEDNSSDPLDPGEKNLKPVEYETNAPFRAYFSRKYKEKLQQIEKKFAIIIQWGTAGLVVLDPKPTCKLQMFVEANEEFCSLYQDVHKTFSSIRFAVQSTSDANEKYREMSEICKEFAVSIERSRDRASFEMFGEEKFLNAAVIRMRQVVPIQIEPPAAAQGGDVAQASAPTDLSQGNQSGALEICLPEGVKISVYQGDITEERVEIIVNAADGFLAHTGGVAEAIEKKGGYTIRKESGDFFRKHGQLKTGSVVRTSSGNLHCKYVVHAVGPEWYKQGPERSKKLLREACLNALKEAEEVEADSVALPAIGSGLYGMPKQVCAAVMFDAVEEYNRNTAPGFKVTDVRFVNIDSATARVFADELIKRSDSGRNLPPTRTSNEEGGYSKTSNPKPSGGKTARSGQQKRDGRKDRSTGKGSGDKTFALTGQKGQHPGKSIPVSPGRSYSEAAAGKACADGRSHFDKNSKSSEGDAIKTKYSMFSRVQL